MKIGIMSMQRIYNYGSFMQAYCLKKIIKKIGFDVVFIDYKFGEVIVDEEKNTRLKKIKNNINFINYFKKKVYYIKFHNNYDNFLQKYLNVGKDNNHAYNELDLLIIGSDEVFNCLQGYPVGYSKELFGKNYENIDVISYAGSFGNTSIEDLYKYGISNEIAQMFKRFKNISVRDSNSFEIVNKLINKEPFINFDPVLVADIKDDLIDNVTISNYIIIYAYSGRLSKSELKYIKEFAKRKKKKILSLGGYQSIADYNFIIDPFELFAYFKKADFVITDTFHGTIFSVVNHSKFATIIRKGRKGNNNKLLDLLDRINRKDRIINKLEDIDILFDKEIDYKQTDEIIKYESKKTEKYLKNIITNLEK